MKLSVRLITYNHERFIAQAIESALRQQVDFEYEVVIGDDCSTDGTAEILRRSQEQFPGRIRVLPRDTKLGRLHNFADTLGACSGQYVALLDGDDYWTSPTKLQKQVVYLDDHPECAICFHDAWVCYEDGSPAPARFCPQDQSELSGLRELLISNFIPSCSAVFRRELALELPDWFFEAVMGDWTLHVLCAQQGKIGYLDEVMAAHRIHESGTWTSKSVLAQARAYLAWYGLAHGHLGPEYEDTIRQGVSRRLNHLVSSLVVEVLEGTAVRAFEDSLRDLFGSWPPGLHGAEPERKRVLGRFYTELLFRGHERGAHDRIREAVWPAVRYQPQLLSNLGVWSIVMEAFLGARTAGMLRSALRRTGSWLLLWSI